MNKFKNTEWNYTGWFQTTPQFVEYIKSFIPVNIQEMVADWEVSVICEAKNLIIELSPQRNAIQCGESLLSGFGRKEERVQFHGMKYIITSEKVLISHSEIYDPYEDRTESITYFKMK